MKVPGLLLALVASYVLVPSSTVQAAAPVAVPAVITVPGPAGSVRITSNPYRLEVLDPAGRVRLAEVPNTPPPPTPYVSADPAPLGSTLGQTKPLVSPLVMLVGTSPKLIYPALFWEGNLLAGASVGMQYRATRVTAVSRGTDGSTDLSLTSNSPFGQGFTVRITPRSTAFGIDASVTGTAPPGVSVLLTHSFTAPPGVAFHGFGGRHESTDLRGTVFNSWTEQENFGVGQATAAVGAIPGTGGAAYLFPNGPSAAYYVQPQFVSQDYAFPVDQDDLLRWRMAPTGTATAWQVTAAAPNLREVVVPADPDASIPALTSITGRQQVPPFWALGPQIDRLIYTQDNATTYLAKVESDIARFEAGTLRPSAYRLEGWAILAPADLAHVIARLRALGIHPLAYFRSFTSLDKAGTEPSDVFTTALEDGYGARTALGTPYVTSGTFGGPALVIDFTNPAARAWFAGRIDAALDLGFDGFMADFGEQVQPDMVFADGELGTTMHNHYAALYQQVVDETVDAYAKAHPGRTFFRYNRTGYLGSTGHEVANFPGDETTDFGKASGLASLTPDMLNRAVGGAYGFSTDIGGYEDAISGKTTAELLIRWAEWAVFSPVFRLHGSASKGTHVPWDYDATTLAQYEALAALRERVAPLIGRLWANAKATGMPITTPLWLAYPNDPVADRQDQEWLLGNDLLVAPVVTSGVSTRTAYLPTGCWTYQPTGTSYAGKRSVSVAAPLGTVPWFTRCGTHPLS
ncbi:MAG: glycoside hydrolase family 31 [Marmoricola sp.]|nr:glycoside hydrolase family 31 [Marmoricola sp.]